MSPERKARKKEYMRLYKERNKERLKEQNRVRYIEKRRIVLLRYSNNTMSCACCGEEHYEFLTLDHVNNDGASHRKKLGTKYIISWIIENNFPDGFQFLCYNCNCSKGFYEVCPHKLEKGEVYA